MYYVRSLLDITFTLNTDIDLTGAGVYLIVKTKSTRFEKDAIPLGNGEYSVKLSSSETNDSGNYNIQPVIRFANGDELPGSISSFELKARL